MARRTRRPRLSPLVHGQAIFSRMAELEDEVISEGGNTEDLVAAAVRSMGGNREDELEAIRRGFARSWLERSLPGRNPRRSRCNPHVAKKGTDEKGRVCYFIYNEDGTKTHRFCYSAEKAEQVIAKADRIEAREKAAATPRHPPGRAPRQARAAQHGYTVGSWAFRRPMSGWVEFAKVMAVTPKTVVVDVYRGTDPNQRDYRADAFMRPGEQKATGKRFRVREDGSFGGRSYAFDPAFHPWDGNPVQQPAWLD